MAAGGFLSGTKGGFISSPGGGGGSALSLAEEGSELTAGTTSIDVVGPALTATESGDAVTITQGSWSTGSVIGGATLTLGSDGTGDVYYRSAGGVLTRLGAGSNTHVLTLAGGLPSWAAPSSGGQTTGNTALTSALSIAVDLSLGNIFHLTAAHNFTFTFTNGVIGHQWWFFITQDGTGGRTMTLPAAWEFSGGANPALSTVGGVKDVMHIVCAHATDEFACSIGYGQG